MPQWEYQFLYVPWDQYSTPRELEVAGESGWEVVNFVLRRGPGEDSLGEPMHHLVMMLKRPKESGRWR